MKKLFKTIFILAVMTMMTGNAAHAAKVVFDPSETENWHYHGVFYARGLQLKSDDAGEKKGNMYVTSEYYYHDENWGREHFPIFESSDGENWEHISDIYDTEFTKKKYKAAQDGSYYEVTEGEGGATTYYDEWWSMIYEPQLFELPENLGDLKKGTVIAGGVTKSDNHCAIVVYYSEDGLENWHYLSTVALGGKEQTGIGSAIWEPFFVYENNALYCFFSDERGMSEGGQKLVFAKTADGKTWGDTVDVCNYKSENGKFRPGMPVVTKLADGRYFMIYEGVNMHNGYLPTYYKITDDIEKWRPTEREDGVLPHPLDGGSPYCITLPDGTLAVGAHGTDKIALNFDSLKTESWILVDTKSPSAYTRCLVPLENGEIMIAGGGGFSESDPHKLSVSFEKIDFPKEIKTENMTITGSVPWGENEPNYRNSAQNVTDGDPDTFFDGLQDGHFIVDLGKKYNISAIGYQPRKGFGFRVSGGKFYGSADEESWSEICTLPQSGNNDMLNYLPIEGGEYRYIKYTSDGENYCNMAEVKFYSNDLIGLNIDGIYSDCVYDSCEDELLLPVREVVENLGGAIAWSENDKSVICIAKNKIIKLPVNSKEFFVDGMVETMYTEAKVTDEKTYAPKEFFEKAFDMFVTTDRKTVYLKSE